FAAIDIGSNAVRLLFTRVFENGDQPFFKKESLIRIPLRLGDDAFNKNLISAEKVDMLLNTMTGFKHLIDAYQPLSYKAFATSAMREAQNGEKIVEAVKNQSGIDLEIIDGKIEAEIIYSNHFETKKNSGDSYLYVDVGGGSTELTLFAEGKSQSSRSFNIGTVRLLENKVPDAYWKEMKGWLKENAKDLLSIVGVGSGGNINKIFRLARKKESKPISYKKIKKIDKLLNSYTFEERIRKLNLRADRADVIVPASRIYLSVMKWGKIKHMYVPQIGLADGVVHLLYERHKNDQVL
ncbi:exopolyphosphatase, partial [Candidatus Saccharibacteria bacterium]|nr:exopolyphosphatase [Candidatus Saccharibacteria bacterium]NIV72900.1 exopolyphosphatase [Calditrichia bacterium]NIW78969.1 exopolyphosphatase [Calditrichia bacterium]